MDFKSCFCPGALIGAISEAFAPPHTMADTATVLWDILAKTVLKVIIHDGVLMRDTVLIELGPGWCPHGFDPLADNLSNLTTRRAILLETGSLG